MPLLWDGAFIFGMNFITFGFWEEMFLLLLSSYTFGGFLKVAHCLSLSVHLWFLSYSPFIWYNWYKSSSDHGWEARVLWRSPNPKQPRVNKFWKRYVWYWNGWFKETSTTTRYPFISKARQVSISHLEGFAWSIGSLII